MNGGMSRLKSFRDVISLWPSLEELAAESGAGIWAVRKWWQRDRIPAEWWRALLESPTARKAKITADSLADLADSREEARA